MLTDIIKKLLKTEREPLLAVDGQTHVYSDADQKYLPAPDALTHASQASLLDCASLIDWCKELTIMAEAVAHGQVVISRGGTTIATTPFWRPNHIKRESANKAFFKGFLPGENWDVSLGYEDMLAWTELLGDKLDDHAAIEHALKTVAAVGSASVKSEQDGGIIRLKGETEAGVKLNASIPKRLKARIPFGDPACEVDVQWALQVTVSKEGAASFRLRHLISDGAFDGYAAWMRDQLKALPEGWLVVVGQ